jgi:hypothetical protein
LLAGKTNVLVKVMILGRYRAGCGWDKIVIAVVMISHGGKASPIDGQGQDQDEYENLRLHLY